MPSLKSNKNLKRLPTNAPPVGRLCVPMPLPDDPEYLASLMGAIKRLSLQSIWDRDDTHKAREVATWWWGYLKEVEAVIASGATCLPEICSDDPCEYYPASAHFISYAPNDPYQTPTHTPSGYVLPPWYTNPAIPLPGVLPTDAMVNLASLPIFAALPDLLNVGLPRFRVNWIGAGEVEIELVKVPQGGLALVTVDSDPLTSRIFNLAEIDIGDIASLEALLEVALEATRGNTEVVEITVESEGNHFADITFLPNVGSAVVVGFGGGVRRVSLCGAAQPGEVIVPQFQLVDCTLQWRPNEFAAWASLGEVCEGDGAQGGSCVPAGVIVPFAGTQIPDGWLECNGAVRLQDSDPDLFAAIGTTWNTGGEPSNAYRLPDLRGRTLLGAGQGSGLTNRVLGALGGAETHTLLPGEMPQHMHGIAVNNAGVTQPSAKQQLNATAFGTTDNQYEWRYPDEEIGGNGSHNNMPPFAVTRYIISTGVCEDVGELQFRIENCVLQWRPSNLLNWTSLGDVCGEDGLPITEVTAISTAAGTNAEAVFNSLTGELTLFLPRGANGDVGAQGQPGECPDCDDPDSITADKCRYGVGIVEEWYFERFQPWLNAVNQGADVPFSLGQTQTNARLAFENVDTNVITDDSQFNLMTAELYNLESGTPGTIESWMTYWTGLAYNLNIASNHMYCALPGDGAFTTVAHEDFMMLIAELTIDPRWDFFYRAFQLTEREALLDKLQAAYVRGINANCSLFTCPDDEPEAEWCYEWDFTASDQGFIVRQDFAFGEYVAAQGWTSEDYPAPPNGDQVLGFEKTFFASTGTVISIETHWHCFANNVGAKGLDFRVAGVSIGSATLPQGSGEIQVTQNLGTPITWDGVDLRLLWAGSNSLGSGDVPFGVRKIILRGTGDNPFGADNCS